MPTRNSTLLIAGAIAGQWWGIERIFDLEVCKVPSYIKGDMFKYPANLNDALGHMHRDMQYCSLVDIKLSRFMLPNREVVRLGYDPGQNILFYQLESDNGNDGVRGKTRTTIVRDEAVGRIDRAVAESQDSTDGECGP